MDTIYLGDVARGVATSPPSADGGRIDPLPRPQGAPPGPRPTPPSATTAASAGGRPLSLDAVGAEIEPIRDVRDARGRVAS